MGSVLSACSTPTKLLSFTKKLEYSSDDLNILFDHKAKVCVQKAKDMKCATQDDSALLVIKKAEIYSQKFHSTLETPKRYTQIGESTIHPRQKMECQLSADNPLISVSEKPLDEQHVTALSSNFDSYKSNYIPFRGSTNRISRVCFWACRHLSITYSYHLPSIGEWNFIGHLIMRQDNNTPNLGVYDDGHVAPLYRLGDSSSYAIIDVQMKFSSDKLILTPEEWIEASNRDGTREYIGLIGPEAGESAVWENGNIEKNIWKKSVTEAIGHYLMYPEQSKYASPTLSYQRSSLLLKSLGQLEYLDGMSDTAIANILNSFTESWKQLSAGQIQTPYNSLFFTQAT